MRTFETGATRDKNDDKLDYAGFMSPYTMRRYAEYMHSHRQQADGKIRNSDNWKKGIPLNCYMESMFRHFMEVWESHCSGDKSCIAEALCGLKFNVDGYLHELCKPTGGGQL